MAGCFGAYLAVLASEMRYITLSLRPLSVLLLCIYLLFPPARAAAQSANEAFRPLTNWNTAQSTRRWEKDKQAGRHYAALLDKFNKDDPSLTDSQIVEMMVAYTTTPAYRPFGFAIVEDSLQKLLHAGEYENARKDAMRYLAINPFSLTGNAVLALVYGEGAPKSEQAKKERQLLLDKYTARISRLNLAMRATGSGLSPQSPILVLNVGDIEWLLNFMEIYYVSDEDLDSGNGSIIKRVNCLDAASRPVSVYFDMYSVARFSSRK